VEHKQIAVFLKILFSACNVMYLGQLSMVSVGIDELLQHLDMLKLEVLRLRAMLLPEEITTAEEKRQIVVAKKEFAKGQSINLKAFIQELGC
jgi:hypothetical protein